jgi:DNA primase
MAGLIPSEFIDRLLAQADIVDVISARIPLKKAGREFQACCPFHHEKTPSFTVSPNKQFYHCFGCGEHGSALTFLMNYDNMTFPEAVEELAHQLGLEVPHEDSQPQGPDHRPLYDLLEACRKFFSYQLRQHPQAGKAVGYLKQRGLSGEVAARYQVGYAPEGWDNLLKALGTDTKQIDNLFETGMITRQDNKQYDRFRDRIMFPIRDRRGRVIGFGGRLLGDGKPKYLNSPETPVFHKGSELYGLFEVRTQYKQIPRLLVVEGYMDVVALAQFGIDYAVASLGTATTDHHLQLIFKNTQQVIFCFDGDRAGKEAGWKALNVCLPHMRDGKQANFLFLPEGEDPDTLVRKEGQAIFEQRIDNAMPLSEYLFDKLAEDIDMRSIDGRARFAEVVKPYLERLPESLFRDMLTEKLNETIGFRKQQPEAPAARQHSVKKTPGKGKAANKTGLHTIPPVRRAVALLLHFPNVCKQVEVPPQLARSAIPGMPLLNALLDFLHQQENPSLGSILEHWRNSDDARHLDKIIQLELDILEADVADQFRGVLEQLLRTQADQEWQQLLENKSPSQLTPEERQRLQELQSLRSLQ